MKKSSAQFALSLAEPLIMQFEGLVLTPYRCPAGVWTVGYGHAIIAPQHHDLNRAITIEHAKWLLNSDMAAANNVINKYISANLLPNQRAALISFVFNLGSGALQRSSLRRKINADAPEAELQTEWMRWVWAGGYKLPGLVRRRAAEWALYRQR